MYCRKIITIVIVMKNLIKFLGTIWALPITLAALLFYVLPFWAFGWYKFCGVFDVAIVWKHTSNMPRLLQTLWSRWLGHCVGNVVVLKYDPTSTPISKITLRHEMVHVKQCMIFGVFQPVLYTMQLICGYILEKTIGKTHGYYDNLFEIHARRVAGQVVDVVGAAEKIHRNSIEH